MKDDIENMAIMNDNKNIIKPSKPPKANIIKETYLDKYYSTEFLKLYFA